MNATRRLDTQLLKGSSDVLILSVLAEGPRHGYALARALEEKTEGALLMNEGVLYPTLHRLEREGCVAARWEPASAGRRRRVYSLTRAGRKRLEEKREDWDQFVRVLRLVVGGSHA